MKSRVAGPSIQTDEIVFQEDQKLRSNHRLTISSILAEEFSHLICTTVYNIDTKKLEYRKLCARWNRKCP